MLSPSLHLLNHAWIPVRRRSGLRMRIRPAALVADYSDPVLDVDWPRADFRLAAIEFLIGLLTTAAPPTNHSAWRQWWRTPPSSEDLEKAFAPFASAFEVDGPGPRFLQDGADLGDDLSPVGGLLIEQPGANTEKNNADLFQKRGRMSVLARSTAVMALYTLQTFAPSGGAGHRTGLRGGGPLITLALPSEGSPTLWQVVWLNTLSRLPGAERDDGPADSLTRVFPWLAPTRTSDKSGVATQAVDIHPAQCFWGMPRRIALVFEPNVERRPCDLTGVVEEVIVRHYRTRPYGVNYHGIEHPLSPFYRMKAGAEWLPVHPQPGCLAWRYWPGFVQKSGGSGGRESRPAACIEVARDRLADLGQYEARFRIAGYDMDNMKARDFVEAERPLFAPRDPSDKEGFADFEALIGTLVESATLVVSTVAGSIRLARGRDGGASLDLVVEALWTATEPQFWTALRKGANLMAAGGSTLAFLRDEWLDKTLRTAALAAFDREISATALAASAQLDGLRRAIDARRKLTLALAGRSADGKRIYGSLGLSPPESKPAKSARKGAA